MYPKYEIGDLVHDSNPDATRWIGEIVNITSNKNLCYLQKQKLSKKEYKQFIANWGDDDGFVYYIRTDYPVKRITKKGMLAQGGSKKQWKKMPLIKDLALREETVVLIKKGQK